MSKDIIYREDAIKAVVEEMNGVNVEEAIKVVDAYLQIRECDEVWDSIRAIRDCLECAKDEIAEFIPSADRPQGEWKRRLVDNGFNADWVCSECGYRVKTDFVSFNFCPHCRARMKGADDEMR